jgi:hypothetical protein
MLSSHPCIDSTITHHDLCANAIDSGDHMRGGFCDCAQNDRQEMSPQLDASVCPDLSVRSPAISHSGMPPRNQYTCL